MRAAPSAIELVVADMAASLAFYRRLGLEVPDGAETEPHVEIEFGGIHLDFDTPETILSFDSTWTPPSGGHRIALAFECDAPEEVDRVYAELVASGAHGHLEPWDAFWGQRYATVHDPDGNPIDLFAALPPADD